MYFATINIYFIEVYFSILKEVSSDQAGVHFDSYYSNLTAPSDVWTLAGGYQPGQWNFRISIEVPSAGGDPWVTALSDGTWSAEWSPDTSGNPPLDLGVSGSVTAAAVPEPATMLLLGLGLLGLAGIRKKVS